MPPTGYELPLKYYRDDSFLGVFSAAYDRTQARLPSARLHPVGLPGGRAALVVIGFNLLETNIGPYGEVGIAIPCTYGRRAPWLLPLLLEGRHPTFGLYVLHLPVTSRVSREVGRTVWGFPKFVADMQFDRLPTHQGVRLSEGDRHILTLTVKQRGLRMRDNRPLVTYTVKEGELIKTTVSVRSVYQLSVLPGSGALELGDHRIADELRSLDVSGTALASRSYLRRSAILPAGRSLGPADQAYAGYAGGERALGQLTARYGEAGEPIDLYARQGQS